MATPYENVVRELSDARGRPMVLFHSGFATFSNFYLCPFTLDGRTYRTSEQFYQSEKAAFFNDHEKAEQIRAEVRPSQCKWLAREIKNFDRGVWQGVAQEVMLRGVLAKFRQNTPARQTLLNTGDALLVEATLYDTFWASGLHILDNSHKDRAYWRGANVLGSVLMEARDSIRAELSECTV